MEIKWNVCHNGVNFWKLNFNRYTNEDYITAMQSVSCVLFMKFHLLFTQTSFCTICEQWTVIEVIDRICD